MMAPPRRWVAWPKDRITPRAGQEVTPAIGAYREDWVEAWADASDRSCPYVIRVEQVWMMRLYWIVTSVWRTEGPTP